MAIDLAMVFGPHRLGMLEPRFERVHDRRAAGGLRGVDARQLAVDEADLAQLAQAADDARQQRAAGDRRRRGAADSASPSCSTISNPIVFAPFGVVRRAG